MTKYTIAIFLAFGMLLGSAGCKSDAEKFCAQEWVKKEDGDKYDEKKCIEKVGKLTEACENGDEVIGCLGDAGSEDAFTTCLKKCKRKSK